MEQSEPSQAPTGAVPVTQPVTVTEAVAAKRAAYKEQVIAHRNQAIDEYDKWLLGLSSGALGTSIAFIKEVVTPEKMTNSGYLLTAWACWLTCLIAVLVSFYLSYLANEVTLEQIQDGSLYSKKAILTGGGPTYYLGFVNVASGLSFVAGLVFITIFAAINLGAPGQRSFAIQQAAAAATNTITK